LGEIGGKAIKFLPQTNSILLFGPQITEQNFIKIESKLHAESSYRQKTVWQQVIS